MAFETYYARTNLIKNHLLKDYGEMNLTDITNITINQIYDSMAINGLSVNTIFGVYAALSSFFGMAVEHGEVKTNPISHANKIRPGKRTRRFGRKNHDL